MANLQQEVEITAAIWGAIAGGITGPLVAFAIDVIRRNNGKLILFTNISKITFQKPDSFGGMEEVPNLDSADTLLLEVNIEIYNQSDIPKTLGDFRVEIDNRVNTKILPIKAFKSIVVGSPVTEYFQTKTFFPKQSENVTCVFRFEKKDFSLFKPTPEIFLLADFPDGKKFKVKVY